MVELQALMELLLNTYFELMFALCLHVRYTMLNTMQGKVETVTIAEPLQNRQRAQNMPSAVGREGRRNGG